MTLPAKCALLSITVFLLISCADDEPITPVDDTTTDPVDDTTVVKKPGWHLQYTNSAYEFLDVFFLDSLRGWILTDQQILLTTVDGGSSWTELPFETKFHRKVQFKQIMFVNYGVTGFATVHSRPIDGPLRNGGADIPAATMITNDGGYTWEETWDIKAHGFDGEPRNLKHATINSGSSLTSTMVSATGDEFAFLHYWSTDKEWDFSRKALRFGESYDSIYTGGYAQSSVTYRVAVGGRYIGNKWIGHTATPNQSNNMHNEKLFPNYGRFNDVDTFIGRAWVCGDSPVILFSERYGLNDWKEIPLNTTLKGQQIFFLDENNGWLLLGTQDPATYIKNSQDFMHSSDGGLTWEPQAIRDDGFAADGFTDFQFLANNYGWIVSNRGEVYHTKSGGRAE